jgi:hypothetical protein
MLNQDLLESRFCIVPAGGRCITKPIDSWSIGNSNTYVFTVPLDPNKPFSYLDIHLSPEYSFPKGLAATIDSYVVKGIVMGQSYYVGDLGPDKMSSFYQISPIGQEATCLSIFIVIRPKSEVDDIIQDYQLGRRNTGPFTQLKPLAVGGRSSAEHDAIVGGQGTQDNGSKHPRSPDDLSGAVKKLRITLSEPENQAPKGSIGGLFG